MALPLVSRRKDRPSPDAMTLTEHLGELRRRLIWCVVAVAVGMTVAVIIYEPILHFLLHPLCEVNAKRGTATLGKKGSCSLFVSNPLDGLSLRIKVAVFAGLLLASPVVLWQIWRFITPGLRAREKRYAIPFVAAMIGLFLAGCATAYAVLPHALNFLQSVGGSQLTELYDPIEYLSLILLMMTLFGLAFEFPVVLVALQLAHVVTPRQLLRIWRWAVMGIVVVAGVFTPSGDPFSMLLLALPLVAFYFLAIGIGKLLGR